MKGNAPHRKSLALGVGMLAILGSFWQSGTSCLVAQIQPLSVAKPTIEFVQNQVEILRAGSTTWDLASANTNHNTLNPGDQLRTGENSKVGLRLPGERATLILDGYSRLILPVDQDQKSAIKLLNGRFFNFHRGPADTQRFLSPTVSAIVRGTDFSMSVDTDGTTTVSMLAGQVHLENPLGEVDLNAGQQGMAGPGQPPRRTAVIVTTDVIQWCLYYPAILNVDEVPFTAKETFDLTNSIQSYRRGNLLHALRNLPGSKPEDSPGIKLFRAAVLLSVGKVEASQDLLASLTGARDKSEQGVRISRLAIALQQMIATIKLQRPKGIEHGSLLVTELLAESYRAQVVGNLPEALAYAKAAAEQGQRFGFAEVRVAELLFGFGRIGESKIANAKALQLSPENAQAVSLSGFLLSADNRVADAILQFDRAIDLDGSLANGWLGRGLCRFKQDQTKTALEDLQMAAAVEPQWAALRSCLAKAWMETGNERKASEEIKLAKELDPGDPTAWLYSGLLNQQLNHVNRAVQDVETSKSLNDNRHLFRSRLLLDEDSAVRSSNLAALYRDAGLSEVSVREATRAVDDDFANYSTHLFLAESYDSLRDARQINLRYETPWFNELLLANLLSPVSAGAFSQNISQQEYSRLFQRDGLGLSSSTECESRGDWRQAGSVFGTFDKTSFAFDAYYASLTGDRPNADVEQRTFHGKIKQQFTPQDTLLLQVIQYENESGDVRDYYDPSSASTTLRFKEIQDPNIYVGFHHEWSPGNHTLFLAARLQDRITLADVNAGFPTFTIAPDFGAVIPGFDQSYHGELTAYSAELLQILKADEFTAVFGARAQQGKVRAQSKAGFDPLQFPPQFFGTSDPSLSFAAESVEASLKRYTAYLYSFWDVTDWLQLSGGATYDHLTYPMNVDLPPLISGERHRDQLSPKAGLRWRLAKETNLRAAYTRSLGGTYYDSSVRLEPSQIAGFNQTFRSAIPESVSGLVPGSSFETWGVGFDHKFTPSTYFGISYERLNSDATRWRGAFNYTPPAISTQYLESLNYSENSLRVDLNQLIGSELSSGVHYRLTDSHLADRFPELASTLPTDGTFYSAQRPSAMLHEVGFQCQWNHESGLFAGFQATYYFQHNSGYNTSLADSDFWQFDAALGYRFAHRRAEIKLGLLNLTDQDSHINPLNLHANLPRGRTVALTLDFVF